MPELTSPNCGFSFSVIHVWCLLSISQAVPYGSQRLLAPANPHHRLKHTARQAASIRTPLGRQGAESAQSGGSCRHAAGNGQLLRLTETFTRSTESRQSSDTEEPCAFFVLHRRLLFLCKNLIVYVAHDIYNVLYRIYITVSGIHPVKCAVM